MLRLKHGSANRDAISVRRRRLNRSLAASASWRASPAVAASGPHRLDRRIEAEANRTHAAAARQVSHVRLHGRSRVYFPLKPMEEGRYLLCK
jgi:hypothetical protein